MARDYKHKRKSGGLSGAAGMMLGLAMGLGVALAIFLHGRKPATEELSSPVPAKQAVPRSADDGGEEGAESKYDFYEMLPKFEVVVPEREKAVAPGGAPAAIERPGAYVLQAGSYRRYEDADRARAQLALQGIESSIQRVTIDSDTWHRVRIGPLEDLQKLNQTRERLRAANINALVIRVGD